MPLQYSDVGECVETTLQRLGKTIVLALPLAIGKPIAFANELYRRALRDPGLSLTIFTALSLRKPVPTSDLERRFAGPLLDRVFGNFVELDYVLALRSGKLPPNVRVMEFFLEPGAYLDVPHSQQNYLSSNYTHVARDLLAHGVNCVAHLVARRGPATDPQYSFGSNPDVTLDLLPALAAKRQAGEPLLLIGQVHEQLPFMLGGAVVPASTFDMIIDSVATQQDLFCPPNPALATVDHAIGLHASALVQDGGTLQIGIGELGDSVCYALLLRQQQNAEYRQALKDVNSEVASGLIDRIGGRDVFQTGLFGSTEMFVDQMLDLYRGGILRRRVFDSLSLSKLIARGNIVAGRFDRRILNDLVHAGIGARLTEPEFVELQYFGIFRRDVSYEAGRIRDPDGQWINADLADAHSRAQLAANCLGRELQNGEVLHAGFFLGPRGFYSSLRDLPDSERRAFDMRGVGYINQLYGPDYELRCLQRVGARFINTTMMVTLAGAAVSDGLADGRVVSGVGGQYNFVAMGHALADARAILCVRATRNKAGVVSSNIVANYGHVTIPRHLRDIVITEYGIADLRGLTDSEIIAALIGIADSRFQAELLAAAKKSRKIRSDYLIPAVQQHNTPERLERAFAAHRRAGRFSEYPFGTDLTGEEIRLSHALKHLATKNTTWRSRLQLLLQACFLPTDAADLPYLRRMGLAAPITLQQRLLRRMVILGLRKTA